MVSKKINIWLQAARPFSFTASMTPVFLGAALVIYLDTAALWFLFPLVVLASLVIHAATNMFSEYFDYRKGIDRPDTLSGSRVIVDNLLSAKQVLTGGIVLFVVTAVIGLVFVWQRGLDILILGAVGILGGLLYPAAKKIGIGDLFVFILMGPLMVIGSFFVLTGDYSHYILLASLPISCHVAAILSANNLRDINTDKALGVRTTAVILGHRLARLEYSALIFGAFIIELALIGFRILPLWSLLTFLTMPIAIANAKAALSNRPDEPQQIASLDVQTAKLHLAFGILLIVSLIIGAIL